MATICTYARPTWLYRYRPLRRAIVGGSEFADSEIIDRELSAIEQKYIWCSSYSLMNDPMEGFFRSSSMVRESERYREFITAVRSEKLSIGIASMSETWDNELMWAHYADGFRGICVRYSVQNLLSGLGDQAALARIAYGDRPHYLNLRGMRNGDERARAILSTKNLKWSYEREWRLFSPASGKATYENKAATVVYLGMRMEAADRDTIYARMSAVGVPVKQIRVEGYSVKCDRVA